MITIGIILSIKASRVSEEYQEAPRITIPDRTSCDGACVIKNGEGRYRKERLNMFAQAVRMTTVHL